jgi:hypothetical protein
MEMDRLKELVMQRQVLSKLFGFTNNHIIFQ